MHLAKHSHTYNHSNSFKSELQGCLQSCIVSEHFPYFCILVITICNCIETPSMKHYLEKLGGHTKTTLYSYWSTKPLQYQHPITLQIYQIPILIRYVLHTLLISITEFSGNAAFVAKCGRNVIVDATRYIFILSIEERKYNILLFQRLKHQ